MVDQDSERSILLLSFKTAAPPDVTILQTQETCILLFSACYKEHKEQARTLCSMLSTVAGTVEGYILPSRLCLQSDLEEILCSALETGF